MPVAERFRGFRQIRLEEDRVALGQVHDEEVDLALDAAQDRIRLPEIGLRVPRGMRQRHERLLQRQLSRPDIVANRRVAAVETALVAQTFENPLDRVTLLLRRRRIGAKDLVDEGRVRVKLRSTRRLRLPISRRNRLLHHLRHRPAIDAEPPPSFPPAHAIPQHGHADLRIQLHAIHPSASRPVPRSKDLSLAGFSTAPPDQFRAPPWPIIAAPFSVHPAGGMLQRLGPLDHLGGVVCG